MRAAPVRPTRSTGTASRAFLSAMRATPRRQLLLALAADLVTLLGALGAAGGVAAVALLLRTGAGRVDPAYPAAAVAVALWAAVLPAWSAWQWRTLARHGLTIGGRIAHRAAAPSRRGGGWLALHPVALPAWYWLAATVVALTAPGDWWALWAVGGVALVATLLAALHLVSLIQLLLVPHSRTWLARLAAGRGEGDAG